MSRNARFSLLVVALILAVSAFLLRVTGYDQTDQWWEIAMPGIVAATRVFLLISDVRERGR